MSPKTSCAILTLDEPWDQCFTVFGKIEVIQVLNESRLLFRGENSKKYFLSTRYANDYMEDIYKRKLIVNIFEYPDLTDLSLESVYSRDYYIGYGSVEIKK